MDDIRDTFEKYYVAKSSMTMTTSRCLGSHQLYHKELLRCPGSQFDNTCICRCRCPEELSGKDGALTHQKMDDTAVAEANTGSKVFVTSNVKFVDAMEDLKMTVNM